MNELKEFFFVFFVPRLVQVWTVYRLVDHWIDFNGNGPMQSLKAMKRPMQSLKAMKTSLLITEEDLASYVGGPDVSIGWGCRW
jgi:hypothetical protein